MAKILFKNHKFEGGSPKSMLEYAKIASQKHDIVALGEVVEDDTIDDLYKNNGLKTINFPAFHLMHPVKNWKLLKEYLQIIKKEKPDLIQSSTPENMFFDYIISRITHIPLLYLIAGGRFTETIRIAISKVIKNQSMIVFSDESRRELEKINTQNNNTAYLIPNRITVENFIAGENIYNHTPIKALLITRLANSKMKSVEYVINLVKSLREREIPIELTIIGGGEHLDLTTEKVSEINESFGEKFIHLMGHANDVESYVLDSHFVFGKGRSALDGVFRDRISFVVNENHQSFIIDEDSFEKLLDSNFTGRNYEDLQEMSIEDYLGIIKKIEASSINFSRIKNINEIAKDSYDINRVANKVLKIYNDKMEFDREKIDYKPKLRKVFLQFLNLYWVFLKSKVRNLF